MIVFKFLLEKKHEKLQHAHCVAFSKISFGGSTPFFALDQQQLASMMYIPQDLHNLSDSEHEDIKDELIFTEDELAEGFTELPMFGDE